MGMRKSLLSFLILFTLGCSAQNPLRNLIGFDGVATCSITTVSLVATYQATVSSSIHTTAGFITQWDDLSGNGYNLTQPIIVNQPTLTGTGTNIGVLFDGVNDYIQSSFTLVQPFTIYLVVKTVTNVNNNVIFDGFTNNSAQLQEAVYPNFFLQNAGNSINIGLTTGVFQVVACVVDNVSNHSSVTHDAIFDNLGGGAVGGSNPNGITIGARGGGGFGFSNISVQAIYIYQGAHSSFVIMPIETQIINCLKSNCGC